MLSRSVSAHCLMYAQSASFEYRCCLDRPWSCRELLRKKKNRFGQLTVMALQPHSFAYRGMSLCALGTFFGTPVRCT